MKSRKPIRLPRPLNRLTRRAREAAANDLLASGAVVAAVASPVEAGAKASAARIVVDDGGTVKIDRATALALKQYAVAAGRWKALVAQAPTAAVEFPDGIRAAAEPA